MSDTSPILGLPYLQPSQAQKHVTHNEALQVLDVVTQLVVEAFDADTPPTVAGGRRGLCAWGARRLQLGPVMPESLRFGGQRHGISLSLRWAGGLGGKTQATSGLDWNGVGADRG